MKTKMQELFKSFHRPDVPLFISTVLLAALHVVILYAIWR